MAEQQVNLADLDAAQLQDVKKQLDSVCLESTHTSCPANEQELEHLTGSFQQLKQAQAKFRSCISDIGELTPASKGKEILIPLTSSLYVPGRLTDVDNVVIDVGTGYYVKKNKAEATKHYTTKTEFVQSNLETLQKTIERKQDNAQSVVQVLQMKMQEQQGQSQAAQ